MTKLLAKALGAGVFAVLIVFCGPQGLSDQFRNIYMIVCVERGYVDDDAMHNFALAMRSRRNGLVA